MYALFVIYVLYMGQFLNGGKNGRFASLLKKEVEPSCGQTVKDMFFFSIDIRIIGILHSRNTLTYTQTIFGVPCSTPVFARLSDFWVKIKALVQSNRQRWTGFDLLIISGVKF